MDIASSRVQPTSTVDEIGWGSIVIICVDSSLIA